MTQPTRRKSSLTGSSPVAPAQPAAEPTVETRAAPAKQPARSAPVSQSKHKLSIYQDPADTARLRAAYRLALAAGRDRSFSDFVNRVLMTEVERQEAEHNGGRPFEGVGAGEIPTGRPVGE